MTGSRTSTDDDAVLRRAHVLDAQMFLDGTGHGPVVRHPDRPGRGPDRHRRRIRHVHAGRLQLLELAVPNRWKGATTFAAASDIFDKAWKFVGLADPTEAQAMTTREGSLLGRPKADWNNMDATVSAGKKIMLVGDLRARSVARASARPVRGRPGRMDWRGGRPSDGCRPSFLSVPRGANPRRRHPPPTIDSGGEELPRRSHHGRTESARRSRARRAGRAAPTTHGRHPSRVWFSGYRRTHCLLGSVRERSPRTARTPTRPRSLGSVSPSRPGD